MVLEGNDCLYGGIWWIQFSFFFIFPSAQKYLRIAVERVCELEYVTLTRYKATNIEN